MRRGRVGLIGIASVLAVGCGAADEQDAPQGVRCTLAECRDQVSIAIPGEGATAPPPLPDGGYEVELVTTTADKSGSS